MIRRRRRIDAGQVSGRAANVARHRGGVALVKQVYLRHDYPAAL